VSVALAVVDLGHRQAQARPLLGTSLDPTEGGRKVERERERAEICVCRRGEMHCGRKVERKRGQRFASAEGEMHFCVLLWLLRRRFFHPKNTVDDTL